MVARPRILYGSSHKKKIVLADKNRNPGPKLPFCPFWLLGGSALVVVGGVDVLC